MRLSRASLLSGLFCLMLSPGQADDTARIIASLTGPAWKSVLPDKLASKGDKTYEAWKGTLPKILNADGLMLEAHQRLAPWFDGATKITLYSLKPEPTGEVTTFHGYPILGQVEIEKPGEVTAWHDFLQSQIIAREGSLCDFMPRHGFKFTTPRGDVDLLVCYHCGLIHLIPPTKTPLAKMQLSSVFFNAFLSGFSEDIINLIFDERGIERDVP